MASLFEITAEDIGIAKAHEQIERLPPFTDLMTVEPGRWLGAYQTWMNAAEMMGYEFDDERAREEWEKKAEESFFRAMADYREEHSGYTDRELDEFARFNIDPEVLDEINYADAVRFPALVPTPREAPRWWKPINPYDPRPWHAPYVWVVPWDRMFFLSKERGSIEAPAYRPIDVPEDFLGRIPAQVIPSTRSAAFREFWTKYNPPLPFHDPSQGVVEAMLRWFREFEAFHHQVPSSNQPPLTQAQIDLLVTAYPDRWPEAIIRGPGPSRHAALTRAWAAYRGPDDPEEMPGLVLNEKVSRSASAAAREFLSRKISKLRHEGYPIKQAIAIAYSYARRAGYRLPDYGE
jgi:hypothetical protein